MARKKHTAEEVAVVHEDPWRRSGLVEAHGIFGARNPTSKPVPIGPPIPETCKRRGRERESPVRFGAL